MFSKITFFQHIITAFSDNHQSRQQRHLFFASELKDPFRQGNNFKSALGDGNACLTSKGHLGYCTSFRECYPYFKIPDLSIWESWVLGNYDSCSYFNDMGRQAYGVCCTNPVTPNPITSSDTVVTVKPINETPNLSNKIPYPENIYPSYPFSGTTQQWPPSFITHPPDHTAATHPSNTPPTPTTTTKKPATTWPTKPPSKPTAQYPKPTITTTTESPSPNFPTTSSCGVKNGRNGLVR